MTINKGQNYTITGVKEGAAPSSKVVNNPNALVMQNAPGRIELVGADAGSWKIDVTLQALRHPSFHNFIDGIGAFDMRRAGSHSDQDSGCLQ